MDEERQTLDIRLPKFLFNPFVWIVVVILLFGGYQLVSSSPKNNIDQSFKALCEKDFGKDAWMSMKPVKDGKELSDTACWGCMVDNNNMTCDRNEYENLRSKKNSAVQKQSLGYFRKVSNEPLAVDNKAYFLYVGGQFCPFCAAERWSIVKALSNFGTWSGLGPDTSADEEAGFSKIPTYSLVNASYTSDYISFGHKETADRNGKPIPGQELTDFEKKWFNQYDPTGGVPFLFLNGQYVQLSSGFSPSLLSGKTYEQVKADVDSDVDNPYVAAINKEADIITAYLCKATGNKPESVCAKAEIAALVGQVL